MICRRRRKEQGIRSSCPASSRKSAAPVFWLVTLAPWPFDRPGPPGAGILMGNRGSRLYRLSTAFNESKALSGWADSRLATVKDQVLGRAGTFSSGESGDAEGRRISSAVALPPPRQASPASGRCRGDYRLRRQAARVPSQVRSPQPCARGSGAWQLRYVPANR